MNNYDLAIDTSYYEPSKNWPEADPMPKHIIARATYGVRQDTEFLNTWQFCKEYGIPRAAYHYWYGTPMYNGRTAAEGIGDQADNFIRQITAGGYSGKERLWLDLEEYGNTTVPNGKNYRNLVKQWLDHVERETCQKPGLYSRIDQLARMMIFGIMPSWIHDYDIWLAYYPNDPNLQFPILKPGHIYYPKWLKPERLVMHQYTDAGRIPTLRSKTNNQEMRFDFNYMYPGYLNGLQITPQTTGENTNMAETWMQVNVASTSNLKIRSQPNTASEILGSMLRGTKIRIAEKVDANWVRFDLIYKDDKEIIIGKPQPYYCSSAYLISTSAPVGIPTEPPVDSEPPAADQFPPELTTTVIFPNVGLSYKGTLTRE